MTAEALGGERRGIGARLRAAREQRGLTLLQAAERLHVDVRVVQALESEDFAALGAEVYVRGHLRRYADALGESAAELQELYAQAPRPSRPDLTRIPRGEPENQGSRLLLPAVLLVVGLAVAGVLWWLLTLPGEKARPLAADHRAATSVGDGGTTEAPASAGPSAALPAPSAAPAAPTTVPQARLDLSFSGPSWIEVSDAEGHHLLHGLMEAGGTRAVSGSAPLRVVLGTASAVKLRLNGQPLLPEPLVRHDGSAHLLIDAAGRLSAAPPRLAHED